MANEKIKEKKRRKIPTSKEEIPAHEGQAGRWDRPDGGSARACLDGQQEKNQFVKNL